MCSHVPLIRLYLSILPTLWPSVVVGNEGKRKQKSQLILVYHNVVTEHTGRGTSQAMTPACARCVSRQILSKLGEHARFPFLVAMAEAKCTWQNVAGRALGGEHTGG